MKIGEISFLIFIFEYLRIYIFENTRSQVYEIFFSILKIYKINFSIFIVFGSKFFETILRYTYLRIPDTFDSCYYFAQLFYVFQSNFPIRKFTKKLFRFLLFSVRNFSKIFFEFENIRIYIFENTGYFVKFILLNYFTRSKVVFQLKNFGNYCFQFENFKKYFFGFEICEITFLIYIFISSNRIRKKINFHFQRYYII